MRRVEPVSPVYPIRDSSSKPKDSKENFREMLKKATIKEKNQGEQRKNNQKIDTVSISEEGKRKYEEMQKQAKSLGER